MLQIRNIFIFLYLFVLFGCSQDPLIENFNNTQWIEDKDGCKGLREDLVGRILNSKKELQGVSESEITDFLGKADEVVYHKRKKKDLIYYYSPGAQCPGESGQKGERVIFEINALGNITWINEAGF